MPANKKYLSSFGQRILKISAGVLGGYLVALSFHLCLMCFFSKKDMLATSLYLSYILWAVLMVVAFLFENGWKIWGLYLTVSILFLLPYLFPRFF